ncbi:MAG: TetR/AcrR family transcriptional regulator [Actinomycetota bacterium]
MQAEPSAPEAAESAAPERRRDRQRRELTAEIIAIARRQLADGGRAGVSWRAIAREVGMNPASLYTYFASLDELFTAVIIDTYAGLADALDEALAGATDNRATAGAADNRATAGATDNRATAGGTLGDRRVGSAVRPDPVPLVAVVRAYRRWALDHPAHYNLIFTDQIPGYAAPPGGPTVDAEVAMLRPLIAAFGLAIGQIASVDEPDRAPPGAVAQMVATWGALHGLVALEINNHLPFIDEREDLLVDAVLRAVGRDRGPVGPELLGDRETPD